MKTFEINDRITLEAETYETRYAWGHKAYLWVDGKQVDYKKITYQNRTWERYQFETILRSLVDSTRKLTKEQKEEALTFIKNYGDQDTQKAFKTVAMIAQMGALFATNKKEENDWKTRMLKAGLGDLGLEMPDDWDTLDEDEKDKRLNKVIAELTRADVAR